MPDAITVNPFCGLDTIAPFVKTATRLRQGIVRAGAHEQSRLGELQDVKLEDGRTWSEMLADRLQADRRRRRTGRIHGSARSARWSARRSRRPCRACARAAAAVDLPAARLRGAGRDGEMTRAAFIDGRGAIVSASRSILYAHREKKYADRFGNDWERCVEQAVLDMKPDIVSVLKQ